MKRLFLLITVLLLVLVPFMAGCANNQTAKPPAGKDSVVQKGTDAKSSVAKTTDGLKEFTLEELARYNGTDGKPAYVAVKGIVYDVTDAKLWQGGTHSPMSDKNVAGKDLTAELANAPASHQNPEFWEKLPKVGILK